MWTDKGTIYQIYPLGFCGAPKENDGQLVPRIRKVLEWLDYIEELGVEGILFNPLMESDRHGYDSRDLRKIDVRLGSNKDMVELSEEIHKRGMKVIFDGVFNHVGRGFWAFQDVIEKKQDSWYKDWFHISFDGDTCYNDGFWYEAWEGHYELVKLNLQNQDVIGYLLDSVTMWVNEFGIDGLRLDVAYCLDREFMKRLRAHVNWLRPEGFPLIGETLFGDYNLIVNNKMLDSCTNYECYKGLYSSFNSMNMFEIAHSLHRQFGSDPWCIYRDKHLLSFVDNHDVSRIASQLNDKNHLKPVYGILFGMPGFPAIYYGSEWGTEGSKLAGADDNLRPSFEAPVKNEFFEYIKALIRIRKSSEVLCNGNYRNVIITNHQLIFSRMKENEKILVCVNASGNQYTAYSDELRGIWKDLISDKEFNLEGSVTLDGYEVLMLKALV